MAARAVGVVRLGRRVFGPEELLVMATISAGDPAAAMERVRAVAAEGADAVEIGGAPGPVDPRADPRADSRDDPRADPRADARDDPRADSQDDPRADSRDDPRAEIRRIVPFIAAVREVHPELVIGVSAGRAEVARAACAAGADLLSGSGGGLAEVAAEFGAGVVCPLGSAEHAVGAGVEPERIVVAFEPVRGLEELVATGWPVLVSPSDREPAGTLATAALAAWLGARVFRVDRVLQTRRALRMVSAIRGDIPPACAVRGLA